MKFNQLTIHMGWIIAVLLACLIGSLSVSWSSLPEIPNIVSIALGLSSLVLALVAIVQALTGNSTLLSSLTKIETAAQQAVTATGSVELAAQALATKIAMLDDLPPSIHAIGRKIDDFSSIASQVTQTTSLKDTTPKDGKSDETALLSMYKGGTNGTLIALYIAAVAVQSSKSFDTADIFESKYISGLTSGYLLALKFSGDIDAEYVDGNFIVNRIDTDSAKLIIKAAKSDTSEFVIRYREMVDNFFAEKPSVPKVTSEEVDKS